MAEIAEIKTETALVRIWREEPLNGQDQGVTVRVYDLKDDKLIVYVHVMGTK